MQTRSILGTAVLTSLVTAGAALSAQSANTDRNQQQSTITVTGCLQPSGPDGSAVGTSGSAASRSASGTSSGAAVGNGPFVLVNARVGNAPGGGSGVSSIAPPGSGTNESAARAGSTPPSPALSGAINKNGEPDKSDEGSYMLRGNNPELPRHVGQEVEISGRPIASSAAAGGRPASGSGSSATSTPPNAGRASASGATVPMHEIEVQTIRMIASVCAAR
jgi:hypothetical protein